MDCGLRQTRNQATCEKSSAPVLTVLCWAATVRLPPSFLFEVKEHEQKADVMLVCAFARGAMVEVIGPVSVQIEQRLASNTFSVDVEATLTQALLGWTPSLLSWRSSLLGWRSSLLGLTQALVWLYSATSIPPGLSL